MPDLRGGTWAESLEARQVAHSRAGTPLRGGLPLWAHHAPPPPQLRLQLLPQTTWLLSFWPWHRLHLCVCLCVLSLIFCWTGSILLNVLGALKIFVNWINGWLNILFTNMKTAGSSHCDPFTRMSSLFSKSCANWSTCTVAGDKNTNNGCGSRHALSPHCVPGTVLGALCLFIHLIFTTILEEGQYYYPHFPNKETGPLTSYITCLRLLC